MTELKRGMRATLTQQVVIAEDHFGVAPEIRVRLKGEPEYTSAMRVRVADLTHILAPIHPKGAVVYVLGVGMPDIACEVVLHDEESAEYVLRRADTRALLTISDSADVRLWSDRGGEKAPAPQAVEEDAHLPVAAPEPPPLEPEPWKCATCRDGLATPPQEKIVVKDGDEHCADCGASLEIPF